MLDYALMDQRQIIVLNDGWEFSKGRMSQGWLNVAACSPNVTLPHCWNAEDEFQEGIAYYQGWGSYRRIVAADALPDWALSSTGQWFLASDGFYGTGDVWLNGQRVGNVDGQYLGFRLDVTGKIRFGEPNALGVRLTNRCASDVLPGIRMPDFLLYGGLSGAVRLVYEPALRINVRELAVRTTEVSESQAQVNVIWSLEGKDAVQSQDRVDWRLLDPEGAVAVDVAVDAATRLIRLDVRRPQLWHVDTPRCYRLEGRLRRGGSLLDSVSVSVGIRSAEFRPLEGFFLNGERVELRGCNRHESMPGFGRALPEWQHDADARLIKAMGLNFVRLSHYPQHPAFLDACDRLGILVYAELSSWKSVRGGGWLCHAQRQLDGMLRRDRNHPSVILWGMGNEGRHAVAYRTLYGLCKALDPQRAVTYAENHFYRAKRGHTLGIPDVWGLNYEFDALADGVTASRLQCAVVSECSNYPHTRRGEADAEAIQLRTIQEDLTRMARHPEIAGFALWCLNDYATLRKQRYRRFSGIVDGWRLPKASARWLSTTYGDGRLACECLSDPLAKPGCAVQLQGVSADGGACPTNLAEVGPTAKDGGETLVVPPSGGCGVTLAILVRVLDEQGRQSGWCGELQATVSGDGRIRSFDGHGTVWIADGIGKTFITVAQALAHPVRITVAGGGLQPAHGVLR